MKKSKRRALRGGHATAQCSEIAGGGPPVQEVASLPIIVAGIFTRLGLAQRVRVLRRLLMPVGPLALAVLGGGVFVKFVAQAHWPRMSISLADAARVTSSQVFELVRYAEQSNRNALDQVIVVLSRDARTVAALGSSVSAVLLRHLSNRTASRAQFA